ncbi:MAG: phosphoribosylformylglycinamidine synthase subunit PurQ [Myxococcaceae bacterium]
MKLGVVLFPGSNCDADALHVGTLLNVPAVQLWHKDKDLKGCDVVILPGGFSYGDYLRCGAIAKFSPIMEEVAAHAKRGGKVIGICNGFQILTEAGLVPGTLMRNKSLKFICKEVELEVVSNTSAFTSKLTKGSTLRMPIAHAEGNYFADEETVKRLEGNGQVAFRYRENPNGAVNDIAGVTNEAGNVLGMMPHPERACEIALGSADGLKIFQSLLA